MEILAIVLGAAPAMLAMRFPSRHAHVVVPVLVVCSGLIAHGAHVGMRLATEAAISTETFKE